MRDQELTQVSGPGITHELAYDALGRCVRRNVNGDARYSIYYIYDGDKPIMEYRANGQVAWSLYDKGVDEILQRTDPAVNSGQAFYFQQDHEGSVTHLTNWNSGSGQIVERYRYDAFGGPTIYAPNWALRPHSAFSNRWLFTGREYLGAWIYDYRARLYHANIGRFMSEDPKLFDAGDYNLFRYCHNDPVDNVDPMGTQDARVDPWYTHAQQAERLDRLAATRELLGLSSTYIRAVLSAQEGLQIAQVTNSSLVPNMTRPEVVQKYGPYIKGTWKNEDKYITDYHIPDSILSDPSYKMRWDKGIGKAGGTLVTHFSTNKDIVPGITAALKNLQHAGELGSLVEFNGSFFFRMTRAGTNFSAHAYGLAIDVNGSMNPQGQSSHQPVAVRAAFTGAGFVDGGTWPSPYTDGMHFSVGF